MGMLTLLLKIMCYMNKTYTTSICAFLHDNEIRTKELCYEQQQLVSDYYVLTFHQELCFATRFINIKAPFIWIKTQKHKIHFQWIDFIVLQSIAFLRGWYQMSKSITAQLMSNRLFGTHLVSTRESSSFSSGFHPWPLRTKISPDSLNLFTILWTVDGEGPTFFSILHWETLSLNWLTILSWSLAQVVNHNPSLLAWV